MHSRAYPSCLRLTTPMPSRPGHYLRSGWLWSFYDKKWNLQLLWILKKSTRAFDYQSNVPPQRLYANPFYIPYKWEAVILEDIISTPFNYVERNGYLNFFLGCVWGDGGLGEGGSSPSNHFWLLKRALALSISNQMSCFRNFIDNKWPSQNFYQMCFGKRLGCGGIQPLIPLNLKKDARTTDYQSNELPSKLIRSTFLYTLNATRTNLQPLLWGLWGGGGGCHSQRQNLRTFQLC